MPTPTTAYLDIYIGDAEQHARDEQAYTRTQTILSKNAMIYGLPLNPEDLSEEQQQILRELDKPDAPQLRFAPPSPLLAGRLVFALDPAVPKASTNFAALCTGEKGACKNAPNKRLHYLGCPMHRIVKGFIAQGGDITRHDGSGGESIYGSKFNDEKQGLAIKPHRGSLAMANSGKNTNTSQFFVVLTDEEKQLAKMKGKYVVFGELKVGWEVLTRIEEVTTTDGSGDGKPRVPVWIGGCGTCLP